MKKIICLLIFSLTCQADSSEKNTLKLADLNKKLSDPKSALVFLYEDDIHWSLYLSKIAKGDSNWLKTWPKLKKVSDGGASQELDLAASKAIDTKAGQVLLTVFQFWKNENEVQKIIGSICAATGNMGIDLANLTSDQQSQVILDSIRKKYRQLSKIKDKKLIKLADVCHEKLKIIEDGLITKK